MTIFKSRVAGKSNSAAGGGDTSGEMSVKLNLLFWKTGTERKMKRESESKRDQKQERWRAIESDREKWEQEREGKRNKRE